MAGAAVELEGITCRHRVERVAPGVLLVVITGADAGELGDAPFRALDQLAGGDPRLEVFIDARATTGATIDVSGAWARWFAGRRDRLGAVTMLTGSRLVSITADFVRRFAALDETMTLTADAEAFDAAVAARRD